MPRHRISTRSRNRVKSFPATSGAMLAQGGLKHLAGEADLCLDRASLDLSVPKPPVDIEHHRLEFLTGFDQRAG